MSDCPFGEQLDARFSGPMNDWLGQSPSSAIASSGARSLSLRGDGLVTWRDLVEDQFGLPMMNGPGHPLGRGSFLEFTGIGKPHLMWEAGGRRLSRALQRH